MVIAREEQERVLNKAFNELIALPPSIFLYGDHASGKTHTLKDVLGKMDVKNDNEIKVAWVDSNEFSCGLNNILESILIQIGYTKKTKCENFSRFLSSLQDYSDDYEEENTDKKKLKIFIVIRRCELLWKNNDYLQIFAKIQELTQKNICTIFCSTFPLSFYCPDPNYFKNTVEIDFPSYNNEQLKKILMSYKPNSVEESTFETVINIIVDMFYFSCKNLTTLRRLAFINLDKCIEFLKETKNSRELWKKIKPSLETSFANLNSKIFSFEAKKDEFEFSLPDLSKYLLVASYIASQNAPSTDKMVFYHAKSSKRRKVESDVKKKCHSVVYTRLSAVFKALLEKSLISTENQCINVLLKVQIDNLCNLGYLHRTGKEPLKQARYTCCVDYDIVKKISKSLNIEIDYYLKN